jgi:hypothetical protein
MGNPEQRRRIARSIDRKPIGIDDGKRHLVRVILKKMDGLGRVLRRHTGL